MATKHSKLKKLFEKSLNNFQKDKIEIFYGVGTKVKIHTINYSITKNTIIIEAIIVLGEIINEEVMDSSMVEIMIKDFIPYVFSDIHEIHVMTRWDA